MSSKVKQVLRTPYFKRFLTARIISNLGNGMQSIALAFGILHMEGGNGTILGITLTATSIGLIVMSPIGGVIADKYGRVRMLGIMDLIGGSAFLVQAIWFTQDRVPVPVLIICNIIFGLSWGIFWPAFSGVIPAILKDQNLQEGNSINQFASNISLIAGTALGGWLVAAFGSAVVLGIDAISFLICGLLILTMRHLTTKSETIETMLQGLRNGWQVFISFRWIVVVVAAFSFVNMAFSGVEGVLGPLVALKHFGGAKTWAFILTIESLGFLAGSLLALKLKPKYPMRFLMWITFSIVLYIASLGRPAPLWVITCAAFFWGITLDLWAAMWTTALQRMVPRESLSRVFAYDALGSIATRPIGLAIAAPLANWIGLSQTIYLFAGVATAAIIVGLFFTDVRKMTMPDESLHEL